MCRSQPDTGCLHLATPINEIGKILYRVQSLPDEVLAARDLLISAGYQVDHLGEGGDVTMMCPEILHNCDAVITIGKTVQMAILANRPVYCYDHFGGPGWLTDQNYEAAAALNFSGRDHRSRKQPMKFLKRSSISNRSFRIFTARKNSS